MSRSPDVLVIGGGIIGLTSAYFLAKAGAAVEVIDRGELGREASWAGAGIIPPGQHPDLAATPLDRLRAFSVKGFAAFSNQLRELTGIDNEHHRCGGVEFLEEEDRGVAELWEAERLPFEILSPAALPEVHAPPHRVPYLLPMAQVRNPRHLAALIEACRKVGVTLSPNAPFAGWQHVNADRVLVAAGAWANDLLAPLGATVPVKPVRGQIVLFNPGRRVLDRILIVGKRYLVPRLDGRVLVGSTEEPEAGFDKSNTEDGVRDLVDFAHNLVPALRDAAVEKMWAGLRPGSPDDMPFIGPIPGTKNVVAAVGHFRAGVQLSLGTAELVRDLLLGRPTAIPIEPYRLDREPNLTMRPAFRS